MEYRLFYRIWSMDVVVGMIRRQDDFKVVDDKTARDEVSRREQVLRNMISSGKIASYYVDQLVEVDSGRVVSLEDS